ncbi:MAG: efflux RND transporter periplasmic adaptor subunit [Planctomycetota bacterium]|jgi:multidrug efflux pump subunit AcrA (membrane-fusion protein)
MSNSSVQEVRDRIIQLAREIEEFSRTNVPPKSFFTEFLRRVVGAVGARAGVIWLRNNANRLEQFCEVGLANTTFSENPNALAVNHKLLTEVISNGQACTYHPSETQAELPTQDMLVLAALQQNKEVVGVVEIFQRSDTPQQARPGFLQFVEQMTGYACRYLDNQQRAQTESSNAVGTVAAEFEQFILQLHKTLDFKEVATTAANDGRLLVGCDRMSVAVLDGRKTVIRAVSGQETVNQRANLIRRMTALAGRVIATNETMEYTGKVDHLAPKVENALADFIQESGSRMVTVIPVFEPDPLVEKEDDRARPKEKKRKAVGGIILEQVAESQPKQGVLEKANLIADHVGSAIYNAKTHHRLFLMPLWRKIGKALQFLEGRNGVKAALAVVGLALVVLGLIFIPSPWGYRIEGEGRMLPMAEKDVFAPWDAEVTEILVESGQRVQKDQVLITMRNKDVEQQRQASFGEMQSKFVLAKAIGQQLNATLDTDKRTELEGQYKQTLEEVTALKKQVEILDERLESLNVKSPINGIVTTFQIEQLLLNRPVRRGEVLLEVKDDNGEWQLELEVEEKRMGHFFDAQQDALAKLSDAEKADSEKVAATTKLPLEFRLATDAEDSFDGVVESVDYRIQTSEESGSIMLVYASFNIEDLPRKPRIGAEVRAKITCGTKSLGYVFFGDVVEFVQKYFWL